MFGITELWLFIISGIALNLIPGPDSLYVIGRSASQGVKAGSAATFGIGAGTFVHIFAAAFGLSALLAASATAFTVVKVIGCVYLCYLGLSMLISKKQVSLHSEDKLIETSLTKVFWQGFLTNALNPKVALFFLAFVPQFIAADSTDKTLAFLVLGLIFNFNAIIWGHILTWSSVRISTSIKGRTTQEKQGKLSVYLNKFAGSLFLAFGAKLALSD